MKIRNFDHDRDIEAVRRIWREVRWVDDTDDEKVIDVFLTHSRALVAELDGEAECLVVSVPGDIRHLESDISMSAVSAVTTSLVARKKGLAGRLTAKLIAEDAEAGLDTAALGMFDQGFYNLLGFGTGPYEHRVEFDPADLRIGQTTRNPVRLGLDDFADIYQAKINRWRGHGAVRLFHEQHVQAEMKWTEKSFGLGYRNNEGDLTHFVWGSAKGETGPFKITAMAYQSREQLSELLSLLKSISDQAESVKVPEPFHIQLQDFIKTPHRRMRTTKGSKQEVKIAANAYWQVRINNLENCLANTRLPGREELSFNLTLTDPITRYLDREQGWQGAGGEYTVHLGNQCQATKGHSAKLPELKAGVPGFSRLWLGCTSATALALCRELEASDTLLARLEQTLSLPLPKIGWDF